MDRVFSVFRRKESLFSPPPVEVNVNNVASVEGFDEREIKRLIRDELTELEQRVAILETETFLQRREPYD